MKGGARLGGAEVMRGCGEEGMGLGEEHLRPFGLLGERVLVHALAVPFLLLLLRLPAALGRRLVHGAGLGGGPGTALQQAPAPVLAQDLAVLGTGPRPPVSPSLRTWHLLWSWLGAVLCWELLARLARRQVAASAGRLHTGATLLG